MSNLKIIWFVLCVCMFSCTKTEKKGSVHLEIYDIQSFEGIYKPQVSILGTFHFANVVPHDYQDKYTIDANSKERKAELDILIERLQRFKPTKILIEVNRIASDSLMNAEYLSFKDGKSFELNDEIYRIAFPLAKAMNHDKVYCSDATAEWFGADLDWENFNQETYQRSRNQFQKANRYDYETVYRVEDSLKSVMPLLAYFQLINSPEAQQYSHQVYLTETVLTGAGDNYIGADAVARWYRRNLRIFSNILDIVSFEAPERVLILYGASHTWTLKQFLQDSPDFDYVEINEFLLD